MAPHVREQLVSECLMMSAALTVIILHYDVQFASRIFRAAAWSVTPNMQALTLGSEVYCETFIA